MNHPAHIIHLLVQFGKYFPQLHCQQRHQAVNKRFLKIQIRKPVPHSPSQNSSDHVTGPGIGGQLPIGNSEAHRTDVIRHHTDSNVLLYLRAIGNLRMKCNEIHQRPEYIGVVIRRLSLNGHAQTFKAHSGVNMFCRQRLQRPRCKPVELDEDQVPDLHHLWMIIVH